MNNIIVIIVIIVALVVLLLDVVVIGVLVFVVLPHCTVLPRNLRHGFVVLITRVNGRAMKSGVMQIEETLPERHTVLSETFLVLFEVEQRVHLEIPLVHHRMLLSLDTGTKCNVVPEVCAVGGRYHGKLF